MTNPEKILSIRYKNPFLWISVISLGISIVLARLNIYLGIRMNYLDYLSLFNTLTLAMLVFAGASILLSVAGLWRIRFKSIPLTLIGLASSAFLILLFLID